MCHDLPTASVDLKLGPLGLVSPSRHHMQVAERTAADKKGGHLARRLADKRLILRESAMCLDEDKSAFEDVSKHCFFNTNNLWVNLNSLRCARIPEAALHCPAIAALVRHAWASGRLHGGLCCRALTQARQVLSCSLSPR